LGRLVVQIEILVVALLCSCLSIKAQIPYDQISESTDVFPKEIPKLVINTDILICGERLHYKVFTLVESGEISSLSKISYVSLRDERDSVVLNHKLKLERGLAHGTFFIPTSLKTGIYRLVGHTNFSLNNVENGLASRKIYIVNPYLKPPMNIQKDSTGPREVLSSKVISDIIDSPSANGPSVFSDKSSYKKREKITLSIENPNGKFGYGNYTLSVRKIDPVKNRNPSLLKKTVVNEKDDFFYIPELRGELISGSVLTVDDNVPVADKVVALSIPGKNYIFRTAKTNNDGRFFVSIDEPYETTNSIVQIDETNREQYKLVLDKKEFEFKEKEDLPILRLDSNLKEWLEERSIQVQIENAYFKQDDRVTTVEDFAEPFYGSLGTKFVLDDYTRFPSLEETFVEVVTLARIRNKAGKNSFEVFDPFNPYKKGAYGSLYPLLLLDGILVQDADEILEYSAKEIESIKVFPNTYRYGPKIYRGIIDFKTKGEVYEPRLDESYIKEFELTRPFPHKKFASPNHSDESYKRLPDYRTQLYWEPNIQLFVEDMTLTFYASDVTGSYEIVLEGYTDSGKHIIMNKRFIVE